MLFSDRKRILRLIQAAPESTRNKIRSLMESNGYDTSKSVDLLSMSEEVLVILFTILHNGKTYRPPVDFVTRSGKYHAVRNSKLSSSHMEAIWWLVHREGVPKMLASRLRTCREQNWRIYSPFYSRPSQHYGRNVGKGLFALVPLLRGQVLCQFTGRLFLDTKQYFKSIEAHIASQYVIQFSHGFHHFVCDPLDPGVDVVTTHFAALINEPSPSPPWQVGEVVSTRTGGGRNGVVREYDPETHEYTIEFSDGLRQTLPSGSLMAHPSRRTLWNHPPKDVANCAWYDFPVPLKDLYKPTDRKRGGEHIYRRTRHTRCILEYSPYELTKTFYGFSDTTGIFTLTDTKSRNPCESRHHPLLGRGCAPWPGTVCVCHTGQGQKNKCGACGKRCCPLEIAGPYPRG